MSKLWRTLQAWWEEHKKEGDLWWEEYITKEYQKIQEERGQGPTCTQGATEHTREGNPSQHTEVAD